MPFDAARTRLLIATSLADQERETAIAEARAALAAFEELGAGPGADAAAALLRSLGVKAARSGPKGIGVLTKRELEVLELLGEGHSNPAIAERLFIARKTVEHHVGSVLSKLELSGRGEATAYAVRHLRRSEIPPRNRGSPRCSRLHPPETRREPSTERGPEEKAMSRRRSASTPS